MANMRKIRGQDSQGAGYYGAPRGKHTHKGIDFVTHLSELIQSFVEGTVTKLGSPYYSKDFPEKNHFKYVQVTTAEGVNVRVFYINPTVVLGDIVTKDSVIGVSQDLTKVYPGITQHIHFEVKEGRKFLNPMEFLGLGAK